MKKLLILLLLLVPFTSHAALTDSISSYWKLDESSGNAVDEVGSLTLTNSGVTYTTGQINNGAVLGSSNGNSNTLLNSTTGGGGIDLGTGAAKSISFWFKVNAAPDAFSRVFDWRENSGTTGEFSLNYLDDGSNDVFTFYVNGGSLSNYTANFSTGTWHFIVLTVDSSNNITFYVDGSSVNTGTWGSTGTGNNHTQIGNANGSTSGGFGGPFSIDEVGAWTRELTSEEVTSLYNGGSGLAYPFVISTTPTFSPIFF